MKLIDTVTLTEFAGTLPIWQSADGNLVDLSFEARIEPKIIQNRQPSLWRYREAIPVKEDRHIVSANEGFTPLLFLDIDGKKTGIKQEQLFSTGSYKDRGATVLMSHINHLGIHSVVQDSSGNAGCAVAAYAAMANIRCTIYLQTQTSPSKIAQIRSYGADIHFIDGTREDVADAVKKAAAGQYYASHSWNPFFFHGTKTFAFEICEQLGWKAPDAVVLPAGNGTLVIGCYIGFTDLMNAGIISRMPKIIAVQSANCSPLAQAFENGRQQYTLVDSTPTLAEGIAIAKPVRGNQIMRYVKDSNGFFITVTEEEIRSAWQMCTQKGFYIEPTSAATIAGVRKYHSGYDDETVISLFSGHGLKSTDSIQKMMG